MPPPAKWRALQIEQPSLGPPSADPLRTGDRAGGIAPQVVAVKLVCQAGRGCVAPLGLPSAAAIETVGREAIVVDVVVVDFFLSSVVGLKIKGRDGWRWRKFSLRSRGFAVGGLWVRGFM